MKKYISVIVLIVLCLICATIFYVSASELWQEPQGENESESLEENKGTTPALPEDTATINTSGSILGEYLVDTCLRVEWSLLENEGKLFVSGELYIDSPNTVTEISGGYFSINGIKRSFERKDVIGTCQMLSSFVVELEGEYENGLIPFEAEAYASISCGKVTIDKLRVFGLVPVSSEVLDGKVLLELEHISQFPALPSGDEITSLAMVLKYLDYEFSLEELADIYLDKGPVGYTSPFEANVGSPFNSHNSYGCLPPVIVKTSERFFLANGGDYKAYDLSGGSCELLYYELLSEKPIIVWLCEDFEITPQISHTWVIDNETIYQKAGSTAMVLIGCDFEREIVTLASPCGTVFELDMATFEKCYYQMGAYSVVISK